MLVVCNTIAVTPNGFNYSISQNKPKVNTLSAGLFSKPPQVY